jgi:predicted nucleotidyltransferase
VSQSTDPTNKVGEMKTLQQMKDVLREHDKELKEKYAVKTLAVFGSYVRGEQTKESDIDILVTFSRPVGFLFIACAEYLEEILGKKVDLLTPKMINKNPYLHKRVKKDLEYV